MATTRWRSAARRSRTFAILGRLENFWDVSGATYFEWGLSAIDGKTAAGAGSRVYGTDFTLGWQPPGRAKYRGVTWRTELLQAEREDEFGVTRKARGGYTYVEGLMRRNLYGGVRVDRAEDPLDPDLTTTGIVPYFDLVAERVRSPARRVRTVRASPFGRERGSLRPAADLGRWPS